MGPQQPKHPRPPDTGNLDTAILRSATTSESTLTEKLENISIADAEHESLPSEDEDLDSDEVPVIYSREVKDPKLLEENWLDLIWVRIWLPRTATSRNRGVFSVRLCS
jgi:hypothetical protein